LIEIRNLAITLCKRLLQRNPLEQRSRVSEASAQPGYAGIEIPRE
jgi:hypothetical protein